MDLQRAGAAICLKFRPNQFNRTRCQNCFRWMNAHSDEALQANKMNRKITKCGFLYVAPEGVDFSNPTHRSRRWQRRWFALYDDGELSYALDQHADTVPQGVVDMTTCTEVEEAEDLTGHSHSLRVTTRTNEHHYFKADTADEIKWWRDLLCIYSKQLVRRKMRLNLTNGGESQDPQQTALSNIDQANGGPTLVQVKNSLFRDRSQRRTSDPLSQAKVDISRTNESSFHGTPRSVKNRKTTRYRDDARSKTFSEFDTSGIIVDDPTPIKENSVSRVSEDDEEEEAQRDDTSSSSWTVRLRTTKSNGATTDSKAISSTAQVDRIPTDVISDHSRTAGDGSDQKNPKESVFSAKSKLPLANGRMTSSDIVLKSERRADEENNDRSKDTNAVLMHTLRKGWLMLKGRSENEWTKHWVVLAGLSLKMYKDAWAEDGCCDATVQIDLTDCESVYPHSAARNYGIEIKCKHVRYVLSALTPGIRDSWIAAMQQNLTAAASMENNNYQIPLSNIQRHEQTKKKRIAYVAPDSHRRDATCETDGDEEDEEDIESFRSSSRADEASVSGRSVESSIHDPQSDDGETATYSGASTPRRRRSLSPTVRRSPVSRVKERDTTRRQRSPAQLRARSPTDNRHSSTPPLATTNGAGGPVVVHSEVIFDARNLSSENGRTEANVIAMLQSQLETVRQELERTRGRLSETETENERMRVVTNGDHREISHNGAVAGALSSAAGGSSEAELDRLRKTLQEAERDIWSKQEEIEALTKKLDYSVSELSDTETVLSTSLHDFDSERAKFSTLSEDWSRRVNAMERQLRETIRRLDERERELMNERSPDQQKFKEISQQQRRRVGTATTGNENLVAQLESKLAESEAKVVTLTQKLHDMEANSIRNNGVSGQSASSSALSKVENHLDGKKMTSSEDGESEIRFDSLRHYCHDQNRRLLATLKNHTEFLQTMVESKLTAVSNSNRVSAAAELKELSDDLIAVHQYIGEIDRHLQPTEKSSPNDFMKDFNFKDVLNRLVEVQERFASLSKRDDATSMSYHNEELESLRAVHATEVEALRRELANEQERRRKLYNDMESMKAVTDHSLATLERAHGQLIEEIRDEHRREMQRLTREYDKSLMEEKEATRQALDALQKAHESELHKQAEKLMHKLTSRYSSSEEEEDGGRQSTGRHDLQDALQTISRELSDVSAAFSAKCVENSRMEDELEDTKKILDQMTSGVPLTDDQMRQQLDAIFQRSQRINTLQAELQARDTDLRCYEDRVRQLESDLTETQNALASMKAEKKNDFVGITAVTPESSLMQSVPIQNGHGEHGASSSSSSEELDDEDEEDDLAAEYQPKIARRRRGLPTSRRDSRYHSTPNLGSGDSSNPQGVEQRTVRGSPDRLLQELRNVMGMSVSERRKYFENLSKPATV